MAFMKKLVTSIMFVTMFAALTGTVQAGVTGPIKVDCVPDAGTTSALMGIALTGLAIVRRFIR
jgi:hypothetical protein